MSAEVFKLSSCKNSMTISNASVASLRRECQVKDERPWPTGQCEVCEFRQSPLMFSWASTSEGWWGYRLSAVSITEPTAEHKRRYFEEHFNCFCLFKEISGVQHSLHWQKTLRHLKKISSFVLHRRKSVIQVLNDIQASKLFISAWHAIPLLTKQKGLQSHYLNLFCQQKYNLVPHNNSLWLKKQRALKQRRFSALKSII